MPNDNGKPDEAESGVEDSLETGPDELQSLPKVIPPKTSAPFQFNQQVNIQQIPPKVWDRLTPEQIVDLSKSMLGQIEKMDARHFDYAMDQAEKASRARKQAVYIGGAVAFCWFCCFDVSSG